MGSLVETRLNLHLYIKLFYFIYTDCTQKDGAVSKLTRNLFLTLHGHNVHRQQRQVSHACVFSKPCTKLTLHCNHGSGHLKTELTESLFLLRRHLGNWPRGPAVSMRSELLVAHEKLGQLPLLTVYVVPCKVRNKFLVNF